MVEGSERHIRWYANEGREYLDAAIFTAFPSLAAASNGEPIAWRSPLPPDFPELWNERFIETLGLHEHLRAFREFWPFSGTGTPHWDAVASVPLGNGDGVILVEAKAHLAEFDKPDDKSGATDANSTKKIDAALIAARRFYTVPHETPSWVLSYYQVCNRLTHLWWMCTKADTPTWLVWVFFTNDPYWKSGAFSAHMAQTTFERVLRTVGLPRKHPLADRIAAVYLPPAPPPTEPAGVPVPPTVPRQT